MWFWRPVLACGLLLFVSAGCPSTTGDRLPFLTYAETFGIAGPQDEEWESAAGGTATEVVFRLPLQLTFNNLHSQAVLDASFVAWVELGSLRSTEQQDALLRDGYVQLTNEVALGTAYTLPVGTFVYGGPGMAGATPVRLEAAQGPTDEEDADVPTTPTTTSFSFVTPDTILIFSQPPVSCDSVAFTFSDVVTGTVLDGASTGAGGYKTFAQVDVYECSPFRPGVFFRNVGVSGVPQPNEFAEGDPITFTFSPGATASGAFATVTIGTEVVFQTEGEGEP